MGGVSTGVGAAASERRRASRGSEIADLLRGVDRVHPEEHCEEEDVQRKQVEGEDVAAEAVGEDHASDGEDDAFGEAHAVVDAI